MLYGLLASLLCGLAQSDDAEDFLRAQDLYRKGQTGEAAITFYILKQSSGLLPQQRTLAEEQLKACINALRTDLAQTDIFGSLISQQKDNQAMRFLLYQYASLLESQRRYQDLVAVHRRLYQLSPTDSQKYTLARKLDTAGSPEEAYSLYTDLLSSQQYRETVLRHMLESVHQLDRPDSYFDTFFAAQKEQILNNYALFNVLIATLIKLGRYQQALAYSFVMTDKYPHLIDSLAYKLSALYKDNTITDTDLKNMVKRSKKPATQNQRFLLAKIYGTAGDTETAIKMLGTNTSQEMVEYRAYLYMQAENYDLARQMYQSLIKKHTPRPQWHLRLAEIAFKTGKDDQATEALRNYLSFSENSNFNSYFLAAKMFERYGLTQEAEQMYLEGKQIARNQKYAAIELMKYYINQKDYLQAAIEIVESQKGEVIHPSQLYVSLQATFTEQSIVLQLIDQIEQQLDKQQLTDKQRTNLFYCLYVFASQIGNYEKSIPCFTAFFKLSPNNFEDLIQFVSQLEEAGFYKQGLELLELLPPDCPIFDQAVQKRADLLIKLNKSKEALHLLQTYPQARNDYLYACALVETGNYAAGLHVLQGIQEPSPECKLLEARIAILNRQFDDAIELLATIDTSFGATYISALYESSLAYLFNGSFDKSLEQLENLCHLYAHAPEAHDAIVLRTLIALISASGNDQLTDQWIKAEYFLWAGNVTGAITAFENVIAINTQAPYVQDMRLRLFRLYADTEQYDKAFAQVDLITQSNPSSALGAWAMHLAVALREQLQKGTLDEKKYTLLLEKYPDSYDADILRRQLEDERTGHALSPHM